MPRRRALKLRVIAINVADTRNEEKPEMAGAKLAVMMAVMRDQPQRTAARLWLMQEPARCGIGCQCYRHRH